MDKRKNPTCSCGQCERFETVDGARLWLWVREYEVKYCPECGDLLEKNGSAMKMVTENQMQDALESQWFFSHDSGTE